MQFGKMNGNVSTTGYENWIECHELEFCGIDNAVSQTVGNPMDRITNHPEFGMMRLSKYQDKSSISLFQSAHSHQVTPTVNIHYVNVTDPIFTFAKYELSQVIVAHYSELFTSMQHYKPLEQIVLSYTQLEKTYIPQKPDGSADSPLTSGFNLTTGQPL